MVSNKAFYEKCLSLGYTNIDDPEQHKKIELLAMELNINYSNIDSFFEDSKKEYLREQRIAEEKAKKEGEEKKRLAVNGKLLYTVNAKNGTYKVYKRPNGSIYSENSRGQDRTEGIKFYVKDHYDSMYAYSAPKNIYTGATVGGVTTGGVSQIGGGYDFKMRKTNKAFVQVKIGDKDPVAVCSVQLSEWGSFLYSENYSNGFIECLDLRAYNSNKSTIGLVKGQNMYERDNQIFAGLSMEAYPKSRCQNAVNFINWYTANFIPYNKSDAADIYKAADRLSFSSDEKDLMRASKMFLFIKDYEDASDRAIATRKARQELIEKKEQEKLERIEARKEARRLARIKTKKLLKRLLIIALLIVMVGALVTIVSVTVIIPKYKYNKAMSLLESGHYKTAYRLLEEIGEDEVIATNKHDRALALIESGGYDEAYELLEDIGEEDLIESSKYDRAIALLDSGDYDEAYELLEDIGEEDLIESSKHDRAIILLDSGNYNEAYELLEEIGDNETINSDRYSRALSLIDAGDCEGAYQLLDGLNYRDSEAVLNSLLHSLDWLRTRSVGDTISFGSYEQDNNLLNGAEDISWVVLSVQEDRILVISTRILDAQGFNTEDSDVTWETSSIRGWLNGDFMNTAFSAEEQNMIASVDLTSDVNPYYGTPSGNSTVDRVFLLNVTEANQYLNNRVCSMTDYAIGVVNSYGFNATNSWYLRTNGSSGSSIIYVNGEGSINNAGTSCTWPDGIRPAMWISIA